MLCMAGVQLQTKEVLQQRTVEMSRGQFHGRVDSYRYLLVGVRPQKSYFQNWELELGIDDHTFQNIAKDVKFKEPSAGHTKCNVLPQVIKFGQPNSITSSKNKLDNKFIHSRAEFNFPMMTSDWQKNYQTSHTPFYWNTIFHFNCFMPFYLAFRPNAWKTTLPSHRNHS